MHGRETPGPRARIASKPSPATLTILYIRVEGFLAYVLSALALGLGITYSWRS